MKTFYSKNFLYIVLLVAVLVLSLPLYSQEEPPPQAEVNLGLAGEYVILAKTAITTTGTTDITGNLGISPAELSNITGFSETLDASGTFATSDLVTGKIFAADMTDPTPANLTTAVSNMEAAYTDATGRTLPVYTGIHDAINETILDFGPGLYKWSGNVSIPNDITISGGENDVWIFEIAGSFDISADVTVTLAGGAQTKNIFWAVAKDVNLFERSHIVGTILSMETIAFRKDASLKGRTLSHTDVTLISNTIDFCPVDVNIESDDNNELPVVNKTVLYQNYPNPFNPETVISFNIREETNTKVMVYNLKGQAVKILHDGLFNTGEHRIVWNGTDNNNKPVSSGIYFYRLTTDRYDHMNKMLLVK